jgi:biotin-(acetyl-CoA carboxylase) ligase
MKAIEVCVNRFDEETKSSFMELYDKIDASVGADVETKTQDNEELPF